MTTMPIDIRRTPVPHGFDGLIVRLGLAISAWGTRRSQLAKIRVGTRPEQAREGLSADLVYYRMR